MTTTDRSSTLRAMLCHVEATTHAICALLAADPSHPSISLLAEALADTTKVGETLNDCLARAEEARAVLARRLDAVTYPGGGVQ